MCSYAAKYAKSEFGITLRRVTGMDAAGPLFELASPEVRNEPELRKLKVFFKS